MKYEHLVLVLRAVFSALDETYSAAVIADAINEAIGRTVIEPAQPAEMKP